MPSETQTSQGVVSTFFDDVINGHQADRAPELLSETVVDHNKIMLTEPEGPGAAQEGLRMLFTAFPDLHADVRQTVDDGECVAVRFELSGTNTGDYRYLPAPTGRRAVWEGSASFEWRTARSPRSGGPPTEWECLPSWAYCPTSAEPVERSSANANVSVVAIDLPAALPAASVSMAYLAGEGGWVTAVVMTAVAIAVLRFARRTVWRRSEQPQLIST